MITMAIPIAWILNAQKMQHVREMEAVAEDDDGAEVEVVVEQ